MALILNLETSTNICSVALCKEGTVSSLKESSEEKSHASQLTVFIDEILRENNLTVPELDAVAVSKGPGSYTGLRIGVSTAKGIAYGAGIPLISVDTLLSLSMGAERDSRIHKFISESPSPLLCPMIDARRMEVYSAIVKPGGEMIWGIEAEIIHPDSFEVFLQDHQMIFFGNGAWKCREIIRHKNAVFIESFEASAAHMSRLSEKAFLSKTFEDIAYFEPFYLKDFIATVPKNKVPGNN